MITSVITVKGQMVVPAKIRRKLNIKEGTKVAIIEEEHGFTVRPINSSYFDQFAGILPRKGKATKALLSERKKDRKNEDRHTR